VAEDLGRIAQSAGLHLLGQRPPLRAYLVETFRRVPFAWTLAVYRLQAELQVHKLGVLWLVLRPVLTAAVYGSIFYFLLNSAARPQPFIPYLLAGVFIFQFFSNSLSSGARAITGSAKLVQSIGFPRILIPVSVIIEEAVKMGPISLVLAILLAAFGIPISWTWLLLIPVLLIMALFNFGVACIVARLSVHVRDVQQVLPLVSRILFYTSGVFFNIDGLLADMPTLHAIVRWLPTYDFVALARGVMMQQYAAVPIVWVSAVVWSVVLLVFGVIFFWRAEVRYGIER